MRRIKKALLQISSVALALSMCSLVAYGVDQADRSISSLSSAEASQRIEALKKSLSSAKGDKRGKIIKKIAEIENKVLEGRMKSSASRR